MVTQETRAGHRELEDDDSALEVCAALLYLEVLELGCREAAELAAKELLSVRVGAQRLLETLVVKVRVPCGVHVVVWSGLLLCTVL
jgi:hypothetical protein